MVTQIAVKVRHWTNQWRQLGRLGDRPQDSPIFLLVSLIPCSIYVHTYQALVHFSTWIDLYIGGADTGLLAWRRKKFPYAITNFASPGNLWISATGTNFQYFYKFFNLFIFQHKSFMIYIGKANKMQKRKYKWIKISLDNWYCLTSESTKEKAQVRKLMTCTGTCPVYGINA